ncbi:multidrug efflux MFS transporter [Brucella melitensis]|nr:MULTISPECIES: multidrug efflux MFS transporter [Brucella]AEQ10430.1 multi-drug resistance efflux protein [Brucella melitensis NI]AIJ94482.1 sugar (and other) transporter family protein [Brucella melitensis bv. 2 str. 63/9]AOG54476.1 MFS transporter [Brucella melitensis]AQQ58281.1 MFS transporter [Brucella melitensis]ARY01024.1 MFS transporter [Brucella melitensis]
MSTTQAAAGDASQMETPHPNGSFTQSNADENHEQYWKQNLVICLLGSFTTLIAMSLLLPFLPLYVEQLGVISHAAIVQWSGIAYGATFLAAAFVAPLWGRLGDRYGRKLMLIRASLGMAVAMSLIGMVTCVWQLVALRLFVGIAGGYSSGSMILVATQTPKDKTGWALGALSAGIMAGIMAGNLAGPLLGGALPPLIGIRATFWLAGGVIFLTFLATTFLIREERKPPKPTREEKTQSIWAAIPDKGPVVAMLVTGILLLFANMSIEPILTIYVMQLMDDQTKVTLVSGVVMAAAALGSILSSSRLGQLADRIGHTRVIIGALAVSALLLVPQAFVTDAWQLIGLRFLMGLALGGLLPCITSVIRHNVPDRVAGGILGYSVSAQYVGQVAGPVAGGFVGGHFGMRAVFLGTCLMMAAGAIYNWAVLRNSKTR